MLGVDLSTNMIDIGKQRAKEFEDDKVLMSDGFAVSISVSPNFDKWRIIHGRAEIWNLSSSVHIDIEQVSAANE